ncbi:MAG: M23 family metallopeptidase [bacterium]
MFKKITLSEEQKNELWKKVRKYMAQGVFIILTLLVTSFNVQAYFAEDANEVRDGGFGAIDEEKNVLAFLTQEEAVEVIPNNNLTYEEKSVEESFSEESLASAQGFVAGSKTTATEDEIGSAVEELATVQGEALQKTSSPDGDLPDTPGQGDRVIQYTIQPGDTLSTIAAKFGVSTEVVYWENKSRGLYIDSALKPGDELGIPIFEGVTHQVGSGDTIEKIAAIFEADADEIVLYNDLNNAEDISIGQILYIPGGEKADPEKKPVPQAPTSIASNYGYGSNTSVAATNYGTPQAATGSLLWPTSSRSYTTTFSYRHPALDITTGGNCSNLPLYAADNGRVTVSSYGYNGGYGNRLCIDHGNGITTCHNHNSSNVAGVGQYVSRGEVVAYMGRTGRAYGSCAIHTHFEVIVNGRKVNPLNYIR